MRFLFIHDIFYARILYMLHKKMLGVAQKTMQCRQENSSHGSYVAHQNYVSYKKVYCGNKK